MFVRQLRLDPTDGDANHPVDEFDLYDDVTDLLFSTYLGGTGFDGARAIAVDGRSNVYVGGHAIQQFAPGEVRFDYPTTPAAVQPMPGGGTNDAFVSRIAMAKPALSVLAGTVAEGDTGTANAVDFTISLASYSPSDVAVSYATADGTAKATSDYVATSGSVVFRPGEQTKTVSVPVNGDTTYETNEKLSLKLSGATGAPITTASAVGKILTTTPCPPSPSPTCRPARATREPRCSPSA